jgi:hypothetical protein
MELDPPARRPAARIVIHMPAGIAIQSASSGGRSVPAEGPRAVVLTGEQARRPGTVTLLVRRAPDAAPPTFESRVAAYEAEQATRMGPIPGLVQPETLGPIDEAACVKIDLRRFANTDPLSAPFNVPNPGVYRFTGLPLGHQNVLGVPFDIIDPAHNEGTGLIVLNGAHTCADFPRQIEVSVGAAGRFLCVLGNVTGWEPDDPGAGELGAVGEYEIRYTDGSVQTMPLISGRTVDDWAQPPCAVGATCVLRAGLWHLNFLAIKLQPKPVESVVVRDLGTPASPVVVALTLVR